MINRESFVFYRSFRDAIHVSSRRIRLELYDAISNYALDGIEPELSMGARGFWALIQPQLDANTRRYINGLKGGAHGSKGGAPKGNRNAVKDKKQPLDNPKTTPNENDNVNVNENENENGVFAPPTLLEVTNYIHQKGYTISPEAFLGYYTANGWRVGQNPMQSWKAAISSWNGRDLEEGNSQNHHQKNRNKIETEQTQQQYEFI